MRIQKNPGKLIKHGRVISCKTCGQAAYNKRSYPNAANASPQTVPYKRRRGRPRKLLMERQTKNMPTGDKGTTSAKGRSRGGGRGR